MKRLKLAGALAALGSLALAASALAAGAHASASSTVVTTKHTSLGTILVTASGRTLYLDSADKSGHFACSGECLKIWPPLKAGGALRAEGSAKSSLLSSAKGPAGKVVTYAGHPLYTFLSDGAGTTKGEGENGFYAVSPSGARVTKSTTTTTTTSTTTRASQTTGSY